MQRRVMKKKGSRRAKRCWNLGFSLALTRSLRLTWRMVHHRGCPGFYCPQVLCVVVCVSLVRREFTLAVSIMPTVTACRRGVVVLHASFRLRMRFHFIAFSYC